ncbi:MAG: hypothetical protein K6F28_02510 [Lachnospiraceae bacterium]|nr:hypothetical protein [Lachnospiraceae bacterium]
MTASILAAAYYKRKITETVPVVILMSIVMFFVLGLTGRISHIVGAYIFCIIAADVLFGALLYKKKRGKSDIVPVFDPGILVWALLVLLLIPLYMHVSVYNWDDFHYWAIYAKNMYIIDGAPNGSFACTEYKDYMRGIQFVYYFVFKIMGRFSEPAMFMVNNGLILTALMPFFEKEKKDLPLYVCSVSCGIILPYLVMFQMVHCLGVDCIMTVFFGYGLYAVYDDKEDLFHYVRIGAVMCALTVTKTAGLVFATVILAVFLIKERRKLIPVITYAAPAALFAIWKVYCINKGNITYLHDIVEENLTGASGHTLPSYAGSVTAEFLKSFFTFSLNDGPTGLTPVLILAVFVLVYVLWKEKKREDRYVFAALIAGMVIYLVSVLYTYLFVFAEWEAKSLSSYDRYVSNYMGALLYISALALAGGKLVSRKTFAAALIVSLATINYGFLYSQLSPSAYEKGYEPEAARKADMCDQMGALVSSGPEAGQRVLVVMAGGDDDLRLYAQYGAVPVNVCFYDLSLEGADIKKLSEAARKNNVSYTFLTGGTAVGGFSDLEEGVAISVKNIDI